MVRMSRESFYTMAHKRFLPAGNPFLAFLTWRERNQQRRLPRQWTITRNSA